MASRSKDSRGAGRKQGETLRLSRAHLAAMIGHARAGAPNEACGLLAGTRNTVHAVHCLPNARNSPVEFELTAEGYLLAMELDDEGRLLGAFHSHPSSDAYPSPTDVRQAYWPIVTVIVSLATQPPLVRAFRIRRHDVDGAPATVEDLALEVI